MAPRVRTATQMSDDERQEFINFVREGGQVNAQTLPGLVERAVALVTLHNGGALVGTAAVKVPNVGHRLGDFVKAGAEGRADEFPREIGWVVVHPSQRGQGRGRALLEAALEAAGSGGLYATTKTDEMKHLLSAYGFSILGDSFQSTQDADVSLSLYVRP